MSASAVIEHVKASLVALKMPRALEIFDVTLRGVERGELGAVEAIDALLTEELTIRENRRVKMAVQMAKLSAIKNSHRLRLRLPAFARQEPHSGARRTAVHQSRRSCASHRAPGTGKTHLSLALGVEAVKAGRSVYFSSLADIVASLTKAERDGALRDRIRYFCRFSLLIVDEIGYPPVTPGGGNLFFQLVNDRYEKGAMILTSNRGFAEWGEIFVDPVVATALLDRLLHQAAVFRLGGQLSPARARRPAPGICSHQIALVDHANPTDPQAPWTTLAAANAISAAKTRFRAHRLHPHEKTGVHDEADVGGTEELRQPFTKMLGCASERTIGQVRRPVTVPVSHVPLAFAIG